GNFGFRSMARGIYVSKSIGNELYEHPVHLQGKPGNEEGDPYRIMSGSTSLYASNDPTPDGKKAWPKDPPYRSNIVSDAAESAKDLDLGREYYDNRNIAPEALYKAIQHFRRANALCPRSEATQSAAIQEELYKSEKELALIYEEEWLKAYVKMRAGDDKG